MKILFFIFLTVVPLVCKSQTVLSFRTGIGSYSLDDIKSLQQSQLSSFQVPAKIVSSFPAYSVFGVSLETIQGNLLTGLRLNFGSTGGRIYYSDYSGVAGSDQLLLYGDVNSTIGYLSGLASSKFRVGFYINAGVSVHNTTFRSYLNVSNNPLNYDNSEKLKGSNFFLQPEIGLQYRLGSVVLGSSLGYNFNVVKSELNGSQFYTSTKADFSGFRGNFSLGVVIDQDASKEQAQRSEIYAGVGLGLDYGGVGANLLVYPHENLGVFAGVGYAIAGTGINGGLKLRFNSKNPARRFFATAMYGYNTAIYVTNKSSLDRLFYGPSVGFGMDRSLRSGNSAFSIQLIVPFRGDDQSSYITSLKSMGVTFDNFLLPVLFSVGWKVKV